MENPLGHALLDNKPVFIDVQRVIEGRLLIQANSGGGKSYALRKFCEITHGIVQQIILDIEGEFASLRDKFDYILVGKDGDIPINLRASELLAKRLMELNTSVIIDLYELKHHERKRFVKTFLDSLINLPKELWHPCLVIIDEAHIFAPESKSGEAESLDSVKDLATRGRKRGYALVAVTQRLSKLSKDVVAELNTKLIGRSSLDVDMKRSAFELGFTDKNDILSLRSLSKGEFYAFGPALTNQVTKIKVDKVFTKHSEAGSSYKLTKSAPPEKVRQVLEKLKDLPVEAEEELKTKDDLKRKIIELQREISGLKRQKPVEPIDKSLLKKNYQNGFNEALKQTNQRLPGIISAIKMSLISIDRIENRIESDLIPQIKKLKEQIPSILGSVEGLKSVEVQEQKPDIVYVKKYDLPLPEQIDSQTYFPPDEIAGGPMRILRAVAQFDPQPISIYQAGTLANYSVGSGTWTNYMSILRKNDLIVKSGQMLTLTDRGRELTKDVNPLPTDPQSLFDMWSNKIGAGPSKILKVLFDIYPNQDDRINVAEKSGYAYGSGTWTNYISILRKNHLIEVNGEQMKASKTLFPMEVFS